MVKLWSINRWVRYTGFRIVVECDVQKLAAKDYDNAEPTRVGIRWYGFKFLRGGE